MQKLNEHDASFVRDPTHGGKVTCHKCVSFIKEGETVVRHYGVTFHPFCFNRYEHYYGLDRPID